MNSQLCTQRTNTTTSSLSASSRLFKSREESNKGDQVTEGRSELFLSEDPPMRSPTSSSAKRLKRSPSIGSMIFVLDDLPSAVLLMDGCEDDSEIVSVSNRTMMEKRS